MKKIKKLLKFTLGFFGILIFILGFYFFAIYIESSKERNFINEIRSSFERKQSKVFLADLTNFEWDKVCYIPQTSISSSSKIDAIKAIIPFFSSADQEKLPNSYSIGFISSLIFFKKDHLVSTLDFRSLIYGPTLSPIKINIADVPYGFGSRVEGKSCKSRKQAFYTLKRLSTKCCGDSYQVTFSGEAK